ncbi:MAG TPA: xanthine dehydrogenase family protein molybdopterin-binding subunit [Candidatus Dormibacteraeota bacterium]|nr:xanthine dehydrogenase family protein molybdopterin-binding subunit [Candidatus Dormibacteraeota bacterium]
MATTTKYVGKPVKRKEDARLIQGIAHYVDDRVLPGMLYLGVVRSPYAHARIRAIDTEKARTAAGVVAVLTAADLSQAIGPVPCAAQLPDLKPAPRPVLALDEVLFVGEGVAVVVATDPYTLRDALDLVDVDYEALTAVVDPEKAARKDSPRVHDSLADNIAYRWEIEGGDLRKAFRQADRVLKLRMTNQRVIPVAMECRAALAEYDRGDDRLTLWSSSQIPHLLRTQIASMLKIHESSVTVIVPEVGGGFGSKLNVYPEEALVSYLAMHLGRPVKWIESRRENFLATIHGRDQICEMEFAVQRDGTLLGLRAHIIADLGAYYQLLTPLIPTLSGLMLCGCYRLPNVRVEITGVLTNKMSTDAYRGAGRPEATYFIERGIDFVAAELKKDPAELRRKNFPKSKDFPYVTATGLIYDTANYQAAMDLALQKAGYKKLRREQEAARKKGRYIGIGLSSYVEICGMGPSSAMPAGGWESATVRIEPTGSVRVLTGSSPHGQGEETTFAQIAADFLGVGIEDVAVIHGNTSIVPYGIGTFGSRSTAVGGAALYRCLEKLRDKLLKIAGHLMQEDPAKLVLRGKQVVSRRDAHKSMPLLDVISAAYMAKTLPEGVEPGLDETDFFEPSNFTYPFGTHVAVVEVDPETGTVKLLKYVAVDDCGNVINPLLVEGQVQGGIVQSIGQALLEEAIYDEQGQLLTGELTDYAVPRAADIPWLETYRTVTPTPVNPLGVKGVGEAGTIGATPALVNAVVDALSRLGVRHLDMPMKRERVWKAIRDASSAPSGRARKAK